MQGLETLTETYGFLDNVKIVTLAPEIDVTGEITKELSRKGITVALGHSLADLEDGERGAQNGARLITHLFNAMSPVTYFY